MDLSLLSPVQPRWFYVVVLRGCLISRITKGEITWSVCKLDTRQQFMRTHFQGSLLLVTGREGESPGNEVAVVTWVGALSNYDDDDNNNVKKQLVLWAKQLLCTCITLFSTFLWRPLHDYDVKPPNATFYGGRGHTTTNFPFSIWTWIKPLTIHLQEKSPTFDELSASE